MAMNILTCSYCLTYLSVMYLDAAISPSYLYDETVVLSLYVWLASYSFVGFLLFYGLLILLSASYSFVGFLFFCWFLILLWAL